MDNNNESRYTNILQVNAEHIAPTLKSLDEEEVKLIARLGEIVSERARIQLIEKVLGIKL